ncbi:MAG TPA: DUF2924 domain-containing protein [Mesorhizobium sp.]|jgi:hypothetical protein|nr:DUF2924 domain-containing protein [Mesorhizobium sp.]
MLTSLTDQITVAEPAAVPPVSARRASTSSASISTALSRHSDPGVLSRLSALPTLSMDELRQQWRELYGSEPPRNNRQFIESRLAYRIQELAYGGLKPETRRRLDALVADLDSEAQAGRGGKGKGSSSPEQNLLVGTRLLREWQGIEYTVTVLDSGFEWEGRPYASLSSVARAITGTRWNGPLFFGLRAARGRA